MTVISFTFASAVIEDPEKPTITSGIRMGTPASTTRGFGVAEFQQIGEMIIEVLAALSYHGVAEHASMEAIVREKVGRLVARFPIYNDCAEWPRHGRKFHPTFIGE